MQSEVDDNLIGGHISCVHLTHVKTGDRERERESTITYMETERRRGKRREVSVNI